MHTTGTKWGSNFFKGKAISLPHKFSTAFMLLLIWKKKYTGSILPNSSIDALLNLGLFFVGYSLHLNWWPSQHKQNILTISMSPLSMLKLCSPLVVMIFSSWCSNAVLLWATFFFHFHQKSLQVIATFWQWDGVICIF